MRDTPPVMLPSNFLPAEDLGPSALSVVLTRPRPLMYEELAAFVKVQGKEDPELKARIQIFEEANGRHRETS